MWKKGIDLLTIAGLILLLAACPTPESTPESPGADGETEQIKETFLFLYNHIFSDTLENQGQEGDQGISFVESSDCGVFSFSDYSVIPYDINEAGFLTLSGTIEYWLASETMTADVTLTGGPFSHVEFSASPLGFPPDAPLPETVELTVDDTIYTIAFGDEEETNEEEEGIPDFCGVFSDTTTYTVMHCPNGWVPGIQTYEEINGTASRDNCFIESQVSGDYTDSAYSFPYSLYCYADADSDGAGTGILMGESILSAEGYRSSPSASAYSVYGTSTHDIYFSATSDNPQTSTIEVSFNLNAQGRLRYTLADEEYAHSYATLYVDADVYRMGWCKLETGEGEKWDKQDRVYGNSGVEGLAKIGQTDRDISSSSGMFAGDIAAGMTDQTVGGSTTVTCSITPETEMFCMDLSLSASSTIVFSGMYPYNRGEGTADCLNGRLTYSCSAVDPDHPGANVTLDIYIPRF